QDFDPPFLKRRRIPGEHRRRSHFTEERRLAEIINPPDEELQQKLHSVQEEIHAVTMQFNKMMQEKNLSAATKAKMLQTLEELKEEFSELMRELRRRKSLAEGIVFNQDEDMDGELRRRPRRLTLTTPGRRASLSTMLASTTRRPHHSHHLPPCFRGVHPQLANCRRLLPRFIFFFFSAKVWSSSGVRGAVGGEESQFQLKSKDPDKEKKKNKLLTFPK
ncbi:WS_DGAT_C domain-containing protein, partial [Caerostris extrusa]